MANRLIRLIDAQTQQGLWIDPKTVTRITPCEVSSVKGVTESSYVYVRDISWGCRVVGTPDEVCATLSQGLQDYTSDLKAVNRAIFIMHSFGYTIPQSLLSTRDLLKDSIFVRDIS